MDEPFVDKDTPRRPGLEVLWAGKLTSCSARLRSSRREARRLSARCGTLPGPLLTYWSAATAVRRAAGLTSPVRAREESTTEGVTYYRIWISTGENYRS